MLKAVQAYAKKGNLGLAARLKIGETSNSSGYLRRSWASQRTDKCERRSTTRVQPQIQYRSASFSWSAHGSKPNGSVTEQELSRT